ncbi:thiolase family protein [Halalkalibacter nanhaiisediminis]|uniref:acetyl-CoA C-acetyltransferase n=1 Tax=Halalkalibacter nanhaiisediminis TaxID=688079 RepID=A0A562QD71_9BACI|nr:thiolase family protein [Halalkalibacter nanhaiisediminis]TWI54707.1 acetyl-CoA C-acetyltransferase [Halalkalibacter nanhaiisediminis]
MSERVYVVSAQRTAVGKLGGALKNIKPDSLLLPLFDDLKERELVLDEINEVIIGQAKQSQDQSNIARLALLKAGLSESLPGYTVHRQCGSGMQAIHNSFLAIRAGYGDAYIVGGVESMSTAPYYIRNARYGFLSGNAEILDPNKESQPGSQPIETYGRLVMGMTAENLADDYQISREEQDQFALRSQEKVHAAIESGKFKDEIIPIHIPQRKGEPIVFETDEHPRQTTLEKLGSLKPVFKENGTVTAGNSSGLNDGASMLLVVSEKIMNKYQLEPLVELVSLGVSGVKPDRMGIGPVDATKQALALANIELDDLDLVELNEAFAAQALAVIKELNLPQEKVNINGGAIALGHPIGNSGARICVSLIHSMLKQKATWGLATLCIAGGQGIATIFKKV